MIDIGRHIRVFNRSTFRDVCGKAFALLSGMKEEQLVSGFGVIRESGGLADMPGFAAFYEEVIHRVSKAFWDKCRPSLTSQINEDVTLLIKCCAMDSSYLERQVGHIVHQLSMPQRFKEVVLTLDTKAGSFLRQHSLGDLESARLAARRLVAQGVVDRFIEAPNDIAIVRDINEWWFGVSCVETHTDSGIPVYPQVWAFEQVSTTYVLQADCDVLIYRHDLSHDYLSEMLIAHVPTEIMGVGFNIPHSIFSEPKEYVAPPGEFKPEVRLGLFNLNRLKNRRPFPNELSGGHLKYGWYQALHRAMSSNRWKCLRGGNPRTAYIHPLNTAKQVPGFFEKVRMCVESGVVPIEQYDKWDLIEDDKKWVLPDINADVVVVLIATHLILAIAERCARSLAGQSDQSFKIVVLEDFVMPARTAELVKILNLNGLKSQVRSELASHESHAQLMPFILILRSDEALMGEFAIQQLKVAAQLSAASPEVCFCRSAAIRHSSFFGLGKMYSGKVTEPTCLQPRCFFALGRKLTSNLAHDYHPECRTFDVRGEIPPAGGNVRSAVMGGFVIWQDQRDEGGQ